MKRTKDEIINATIKYVSKNEHHLLNDKQKNIIKPYMWRYKLAIPFVHIRIFAIKTSTVLSNLIVKTLNKLEEITENNQFKLETLLEKDPLIIRELHNKFIDDLVKNENDDGSELSRTSVKLEKHDIFK